MCVMDQHKEAARAKKIVVSLVLLRIALAVIIGVVLLYVVKK
jgi:hypothetical protein